MILPPAEDSHTSVPIAAQIRDRVLCLSIIHVHTEEHLTPSSAHGNRSTPSDPQRLSRPRPPSRNRSKVPDHVRNPHRYTCYTLDEPILVGGGDQGSTAADGGQAEMERVGTHLHSLHSLAAASCTYTWRDSFNGVTEL